MLKSIIASVIIMFVLAGGYAIVSLIRAKYMGPSAPHSCTDGCSSCTTHCADYDPDKLKAEIKASMEK